ncbi:MAG: PEP-CTERM sorting domain-containing protein [Rubrivivax sp.]
MMKLAAKAACAAISLTFTVSSAYALTVIDSFDFGTTVVTDTSNGSGSTTAGGINAAFSTTDPTRYFSYTTDFGHVVRYDNQTVAGSMLLSHVGGSSYSYMNLSYGFSLPTDLTGFNRVSALGSGSGTGEIVLALTDADGDTLLSSRAIAGAFGNIVADFAGMTCLSLGSGSCDLTKIVSFEFMAGGFNGVSYSHQLNELNLSFFTGTGGGGVVPVAPIPEPSTYALMLAGLGLVAAAARKRKASAQA